MTGSARAMLPRGLRLPLALLVPAAAFALLVAARPEAPVAPLALAIAFVLMGASEMGAVRLPGGGWISLGGALDVACLVALGPLATAWLDVASTVLVQGVVLRRSPLTVAYNAAAFAFTTVVSGAAFAWSGGVAGRLDLPGDLAPLAVAGAVYLGLNLTFAALGIGRGSGEAVGRTWLRLGREGWLHHLSFLPLGGALALATLRLGPWGLALCAVPFLLARHAFRQYAELRTDLRDFVHALSEVLDEVDPYTRQHSIRVARYSVRLARALGCSPREIDDVETAALVHDLGKIGPQHQRILRKAGSLSHEDQRTMRGHPATGAGIVGRVRALRRVAQIVRLHHERPDGRGYPLGLGSDEVPRGARILNVADAFDAMTSDRPYRGALPVETALRELRRGAGTQFDAEVVGCLDRLHTAGAFERIEGPSREELRELEAAARGVIA